MGKFFRTSVIVSYPSSLVNNKKVTSQITHSKLNIEQLTADTAHFTLNITQHTADTAHFKTALYPAPPQAPVVVDTVLIGRRW